MRVIALLSLLSAFLVGCTTTKPIMCQPVPAHMTAQPTEPVCESVTTNADVNECIVRVEKNRQQLKSKLRQIDIHQAPCRRN